MTIWASRVLLVLPILLGALVSPAAAAAAEDGRRDSIEPETSESGDGSSHERPRVEPDDKLTEESLPSGQQTADSMHDLAVVRCGQERIDEVSLDDQWLANRINPHHVFELDEPLSAGAYKMTLVSYDNHSDDPDSPPQLSERWFIELYPQAVVEPALGAEGAVFSPLTSAELAEVDDEAAKGAYAIPDLDEEVDWFVWESPRPIVLTGEATHLLAVHFNEMVNGELVGASPNSVTAVCAVLEPVEPGTMVITKNVISADPEGDDTPFSFVGALETTLTGGTSRSIDLVPGTHSVTEVALEGWTLTNIECDSDDPLEDLETRTATVNIKPGETVTCTFTNQSTDLTFCTPEVVLEDQAIAGGAVDVATFEPLMPGPSGAYEFEYKVSVLWTNPSPEATDCLVREITLTLELDEDLEPENRASDCLEDTGATCTLTLLDPDTLRDADQYWPVAVIRVRLSPGTDPPLFVSSEVILTITDTPPPDPRDLEFTTLAPDSPVEGQTTSSPVETPPPEAPAAPPPARPNLPVTGSETGQLLPVGIALAGLGALLVVLAGASGRANSRSKEPTWQNHS